jgi:hypothetical protein
MFRRVFSLIKENLKGKPIVDPKVSLYKKTEAFDVPNTMHVKFNPQKIKVENIDPEFVKLNKKQQHVLIKYMEESSQLYRMNEIHMDSDLIKAFLKIEAAIEREEIVLKYWVDLVLNDMDRSHSGMGCSNSNFYSLDDEIIL